MVEKDVLENSELPEKPIAPPDDVTRCFPPPYPPFPSRVAMTIDFSYMIGDYVKIKNLDFYGVILGAAAAFKIDNILYLVELGSGETKWYPSSLIEPVPMYDRMEPQTDGEGLISNATKR